jgi:hypothetical protein
MPTEDCLLNPPAAQFLRSASPFSGPEQSKVAQCPQNRPQHRQNKVILFGLLGNFVYF